MATQAFDYLAISDGTTSVVFMDGLGGFTNYRVVNEQWSPAVAHLSDSQLGGRGPYQDVTEDLDITVSGATWTAAKANVGALERLLQQATRWARGENVAVVLVKWAPKGSTVASTAAPYQAVVLGGAVEFAPRWNTDQFTFWTPAHLSFTRRGAWLLGTAVTASSSSTANPGTYAIAGMANAAGFCPTQVKLTGFTASSHPDLADCLPILLTAQQASDIQIISPYAGSTGTYTVVADSANKAVGGSVLRFTPIAGTGQTTGVFGASAMTSTARRFAFYAAVRNNSASISWQMRVYAQTLLDAEGFVIPEGITPLVTVDTSHTRPRFVPLGVVTMPASLSYVSVYCLPSGSAGSPTLDINYLVAQAVDNPYARALQLAPNAAAAAYTPVDFTTAWDLIVDPLALSGVAPQVWRNKPTTSNNDVSGYYGDAYPVGGSTTFAAAFLGKRSDQTSFWTYCAGGSAASPASLTLTVNRYPAYLVPE